MSERELRELLDRTSAVCEWLFAQDVGDDGYYANDRIIFRVGGWWQGLRELVKQLPVGACVNAS